MLKVVDLDLGMVNVYIGNPRKKWGESFKFLFLWIINVTI